MATPVVPSSNIRLLATLGESCSLNETANISLASVASGGTFNGIQNTFGSSGGPAYLFDGGLGEYQLELEEAPFSMGSFVGGFYN